MPVQVPGSAVSVCPCTRLPVTVGATVFDGATGAAATVAVAADGAVPLPAALVPVTRRGR